MFALVNGLILVTVICGSIVSGNVSKSFRDSELVPDILSEPPACLMNVVYSSGAVVSEGKILPVPDIGNAPTSVSWGAQDGVNYSVMMIDVDPPSRELPELRSFLHWLVINAQNDDVTTGSTVAEYVPPLPPPGAGLHRYTFLVYKQPSQFHTEDFEMFELNRMKFDPEEFAANYNLGEPIGGNFLQAETLHKDIGTIV